jgi:hypothetical protein
MDLVFIIPVLTIVLLSIYRFVEFKFITHEFKPVKFYIQESVLIVLSAVKRDFFKRRV